MERMWSQPRNPASCIGFFPLHKLLPVRTSFNLAFATGPIFIISTDWASFLSSFQKLILSPLWYFLGRNIYIYIYLADWGHSFCSVCRIYQKEKKKKKHRDLSNKTKNYLITVTRITASPLKQVKWHENLELSFQKQSARQLKVKSYDRGWQSTTCRQKSSYVNKVLFKHRHLFICCLQMPFSNNSKIE